MKVSYYSIGSVRGICGHHHRTIMGAIRCLKADQSWCRHVGGYSDRRLRVLEDGKARDLEDEDMGAEGYRALYGA